MLGQVLERGTDFGEILDYASKFVDDKDALGKAFKRLHQKSIQQIESFAKLMEISTCYLEIRQLFLIVRKCRMHLSI